MSLPGTRQQKSWFFVAVTPAVRLNTYNLPNQQTYENLVSSAAFILNSEDSADPAQTQQGLVLKSLPADILSALDTKSLGFGNLALSVSPMQLPVVALNGGTVAVTQNMTTGALLYTLPPYLLASDGDVTITSPVTGQILQWNGTKWVNAGVYYQAVWSNLTPKPTEPALNFCSVFSVTDDTVNHCTTVCVTTNGITYSLMQQTSGSNVLLGNSTGSPGNISEQTVGSGLTLSGGSLSITNNGITYAKLQQASAGFVILANPTTTPANYKETAISSAFSFISNTTLDLAVNGVTYGKIQQTSTGQVLLGNSSNSAGNVGEIAVQGMQLKSGVLSAKGGKAVTGATYVVVPTDFNGLILGFTYTATGTVAVSMCNPTSVPAWQVLDLKDLAGAAATHNITVNPFSGETFDGAATLVINTNYGKSKIFTPDNVNWYTI